MPTVPSDGASVTTATVTTAMIVRATKFGVAQYLHKDVLHGVNQISNPKIALRCISDTRALSLVQFLRVYGSDPARETLFFKITAAASRFEKILGAPLATFCVPDEAAYVVLLDERPQIQALRYHYTEGDAASVEAPVLVRCATRDDGHPITQTEALKLKNLCK